MDSSSEKRYLVLGNGWLGTRIAEYLGAQTLEKHFKTGTDFPPALFDKFDVMINAIARTNIDWCEQNKSEAQNSNVTIAANLAKLCSEHGKKFVHLSSACIFESKGEKDVKFEDSEPAPACFYSETKVLAEKLVLEACPDALIVRIRLPISEVPHPRNTVTKILSYSTLSSQPESVTIVEDALPALKQLMEKGVNGTYHLINEGVISPAEIGAAFGHKFKTCTKKELDELITQAGKVKRVTVYAGSKKIPPLPDVRKRIVTLAKNYRTKSARPVPEAGLRGVLDRG